MPQIKTTKLTEGIEQLNTLKEIKALIKESQEAKGKVEQELQKTKEKLHEIDCFMDELIDATIEFLTQTKDLYESYDQDYVDKFTKGG